MSHFFLIFLATVIVTRLFVFIYPVPSLTLMKFRIHHYMYGILGVILGLVFNSIIVYAIGLGLFIDELTYILMRGKTHEDNYSKISLIGTICFIVIVFILREYLTTPFY